MATATGRDVDAESATILARVREVAPDAATLFDAACGSGAYLERLGKRYAVTGVDRDPVAVQVARSRTGGERAWIGAIESFETTERYDVVIALRGAVAEARSLERLHAVVARLAALRKPGGVLIVEPFLAPETYEVGAIEAVHVDEPRVKISRMIVTKRVAHLAVLDYHYLIATNHGIERHFERIERGLYTAAAYAAAFAAAGLSVEGLTERTFPLGLFRGR